MAAFTFDKHFSVTDGSRLYIVDSGNNMIRKIQ